MIPCLRPRGALLGATLWACLAAGCADSPTPHPALGRHLAPLPITAIDDPEAEPPSMIGKVTLLNFWGTWCEPCRQELPGLLRIADRLADDPRFQFVAVSCGSGDFIDIAAETEAFLLRERLAMRAWAVADPLGMAQLVATVSLDSFPTTLLVGTDGSIRRVWVGYRPEDEADMAAAIVGLLKEAAAAR